MEKKTCLFELHFSKDGGLDPNYDIVVQTKWNLFEAQSLCKDMAADCETAYFHTRKEKGGIPLI